MTDFLKIAKSIVVHFAHICAYGVETVKGGDGGGGNIFVFCYKRHGYMMRSSKFFRRGKGECDKSEL